MKRKRSFKKVNKKELKKIKGGRSVKVTLVQNAGGACRTDK